VDDVILLKDSKQRLLQLVDAIIENSLKVRLTNNVEKSKSISIINSVLILHHKKTNIKQVKDF